MKGGLNQDSIVKDMSEDVLNGSMDITTITTAIDQMHDAAH